MLRYTMHAEAVDEQLHLLHAVYDELDQRRPDAFSFVTYQLEGGDEFVDLAAAPSLPGPLSDMASFRRYRTDLEQRCSQRVVSDLRLVGAYRTLDLSLVRPVNSPGA